MKVRILPGDVCILFPEDAHAPSIQAGDTPVHVKKLIAKVAVRFPGTGREEKSE